VAPTDLYSPDSFDDFDADDPNTPDELDDLSALDALDELLSPPSQAATPELPVSAPATSTQPATEMTSGAPEADEAASPQARAHRRIQALRSVRGGGIPVAQQRTAYRNLIIGQIGEPEAAALIRSVWRITPDRLGPEQYDELIRWGKEDDFADEVPLVMAALRAERAGQPGQTKPTPPAGQAEQPTPAKPTAHGVTPTRTPRRTASSANTAGAAGREGAPQAGR
jgi:hypothetical protein